MNGDVIVSSVRALHRRDPDTGALSAAVQVSFDRPDDEEVNWLDVVVRFYGRDGALVAVAREVADLCDGDTKGEPVTVDTHLLGDGWPTATRLATADVQVRALGVEAHELPSVAPRERGRVAEHVGPILVEGRRARCAVERYSFVITGDGSEDATMLFSVVLRNDGPAIPHVAVMVQSRDTKGRASQEHLVDLRTTPVPAGLSAFTFDGWTQSRPTRVTPVLWLFHTLVEVECRRVPVELVDDDAWDEAIYGFSDLEDDPSWDEESESAPWADDDDDDALDPFDDEEEDGDDDDDAFDPFDDDESFDDDTPTFS